MFPTVLFKTLLAVACVTLTSLFLSKPPSIILLPVDDFGLSLDSAPETDRGPPSRAELTESDAVAADVHWANTSELFPVSTLAALPTGTPLFLPLIQQGGPVWKAEEEEIGLEDGTTLGQARQQIKSAFLRSWQSYKEHAWGHDELAPISGSALDPLNGWAATMIEALDTMWLMDLKEDFESAVSFVTTIDFTTSRRRQIPIHATTVRCLGGLLGAYEVSEHKFPELLHKAEELGDVIVGAFDTPNRIPISLYDWTPESTAKPHRASSSSTLSELASMTLELTRLSQLTGQPKYFDAADSVLASLETLQGQTDLAGMWPAEINASGCKHTLRSGKSCVKTGLTSSLTEDENVYSVAEGAASVYSSLLKQQMLLGVEGTRAAAMYSKALKPMLSKLLFRPLTGGAPDWLMLGEWVVEQNANWLGMRHGKLEPRMSRSSCATVSMLALSSAALDRPDDLVTAIKLVEGCLWAHDKSKSKLMPASFTMLACKSRTACKWDPEELHQYWDALDVRLQDDFDIDEYFAMTALVEDNITDSEDDDDDDDAWHSLIEARDTDESDTTHDANDLNGTGADHTNEPLEQISPHSNPLLSQTASHPSPFLAHEDFVRDRMWLEGLAEGMLDIHDRTFDLGPELAEALFTLYRITGDARWRTEGVKLFKAMEAMTATELGNTMLKDVTRQENEREQRGVREDVMPSWWMGATLKWFWLLMENESVLSLDEWVFTAGGHPFRMGKGDEEAGTRDWGRGEHAADASRL